jgi:hypothetical protein
VIGGWVLDADALTGFATGSSVYVQALVWTAVEENVVLAVPATVLAQSVARINERDQPALTVLLDLPVTIVDDLERQRATDVGHLLAVVAGDDLALGHAVRCAQQRGWPLVTGDKTAARRLDDAIDVRELP